MLSNIAVGNPVIFPTWLGERIYMQEFRKDVPLPPEYSRWQPTVDQMLVGIDTTGPIYLMVDQCLVPAGTTHRRSGVHVDGHWVVDCHGGRHSSHTSVREGDRHTANPPTHKGKNNNGRNELLLLSSDVGACRAYIGTYDRDFVADWRGGDCSDLDLSGLSVVDLQPNHVYIGDVFTLHESIPVSKTCTRTLVRLNVVLQ